jgi:hypothetical protein
MALLGVVALLAGLLQNCFRWSDTTPVPPRGALLVKRAPTGPAAHILRRT